MKTQLNIIIQVESIRSNPDEYQSEVRCIVEQVERQIQSLVTGINDTEHRKRLEGQTTFAVFLEVR